MRSMLKSVVVELPRWVRARAPIVERSVRRLGLKQVTVAGLQYARRMTSGLSHNPYLTLAEDLSQMGDDFLAVTRIMRQWESLGLRVDRHDALKRMLVEHEKPHLANYLLARYEMEHKIEITNSFPNNVHMDLSSVCNVQCRFCKYTNNHIPATFLTMDQVKAIEWLRWVWSFNFSSGTAESIIHPQFVEIFDYIRNKHPHLYLTILTNGRALKQDRLDAFKDRLDYLYVSMNASNERDYNEVIDAGSWKQFSENMRRMRDTLKDAKRPRIQANFVMMRWNIDRALENLEFAAAHGAHHVTFIHFYPHYIPDLHKENAAVLARKFTLSNSLYHEREKSDRIFAQVAERARELGVEVTIPAPFGKPSYVDFSLRSPLQRKDQDCFDPWSKLFLLWGWKSKREEITICCGLASDIGVYFERDEIASIDGIKRAWNSPALQAYRRSVNGDYVNPICAACRKTDKFDPSAFYPDQRDFFRFNNLPIPPHFQDEKATV